jgi:hypothetical protein
VSKDHGLNPIPDGEWFARSGEIMFRQRNAPLEEIDEPDVDAQAE